MSGIERKGLEYILATDDYVKALETLLYDAIVELSYIQESETHEMCASAKGKHIIDLGMATLGVDDLSAETWKDVIAKEKE